MSRVLIIGGSGRTGRLVAHGAKRLGHEVTVTARPCFTYKQLTYNV